MYRRCSLNSAALTLGKLLGSATGHLDADSLRLLLHRLDNARMEAAATAAIASTVISSILCLALVVLGIGAATFFHEGGAPIVAPTVQNQPLMARRRSCRFYSLRSPAARSAGFTALSASGTTSKQIACETDAQFVGYGAMLTEGFLAVLVILACCAGVGLGWTRMNSCRSESSWTRMFVLEFL